MAECDKHAPDLRNDERESAYRIEQEEVDEQPEHDADQKQHDLNHPKLNIPDLGENKHQHGAKNKDDDRLDRLSPEEVADPVAEIIDGLSDKFA